MAATISRISIFSVSVLEHDPEKWEPVFGIMLQQRVDQDGDSTMRHPDPGRAATPIADTAP